MKKAWFLLTIVLVAAALAASAVLLVDYVRPAPVFCGVDGGCTAVKKTIFARPLGIPLPALGLLGMLAIGLAALVPGREARITQTAFSAIAGGVAVLLFGVQYKLGVLCPFCAVVDGASIVLAVVAFVRLKKELDPLPGRAVPGGSIALMLAAIGVPLAIGFQQRSIPLDVPHSIALEMRSTPRGKVTVIDFVDFECPYCRATHAVLKPALEKRHDKVRVVRKHVPLRMHPHALDAARAGCCGEALGKGDEITDALFTTDPEALTPEGCEKIAEQAGLDMNRFRACVKDPATQARIDRDREAFRDAKGHGLPTIWIDGTKLEGEQDRESIDSALDAAITAL